MEVLEVLAGEAVAEEEELFVSATLTITPGLAFSQHMVVLAMPQGAVETSRNLAIKAM